MKTCDTVFRLFSILGSIAYFSSLYMSIIDNKTSIILINTLALTIWLILTFYKKIPYSIKTIVGTGIVYLLGLLFIIFLGPKGAGVLWLFASTIIAALLIGEKGAIIVFIINVLTHLIIFFCIKQRLLPWQSEFNITPDMWIVQSVNFAILNLVIILTNNIYLLNIHKILKRNVESRNASILGLAKLAEYRDSCTGNHLRRLQLYGELLTKELQKIDKYSQFIDIDYINDLCLSSMLHDIGKVGITDSVLLKPGKLTSDEFTEMKIHPILGYNVIKEIEENIKGRSLYTMAKHIALYHHERWDGKGYPKGKKGEEIPLSARIVAVIDVYDALTTQRPYKKEYTHDEAIKIINEEKGTHFDPEIIDAFNRISQELVLIHNK